MWFAKLFNRHVEETADDDEPARFPMQIPAQDAVARAPVTAKNPSKPAVKGFDPYNSGSFERRNAWERVNKR